MQIPSSDIWTTYRLGKIFDNTVATYKYFWFISIMQIHARTDNPRINVWDVLIRMIANAWYPIHYFRLSFGKSDSLFDIAMELQRMTQIPIDASVDRVVQELQDRLCDNRVRSKVRILAQNVPYRFLRPWINTSDDKEMVRRSQSWENGCLYALHKESGDFHIILNKDWDFYLHKHYNIMMDFAYWNLTLFLQARNPNVPAIPSKLIRPETRSPLGNQHRYWDMVMELGDSLCCIYTGRELHPSGYDLDHFIPWSFVSHDLLWNLVPADGSVNSSKANKLPDLAYYLPRLVNLHHRSLKTFIHAGKSIKILEDYISLGYTARELADMSDEKFRELYERIFYPLNQIALNMGFETWK